jgi:hypothetical protein
MVQAMRVGHGRMRDGTLSHPVEATLECGSYGTYIDGFCGVPAPHCGADEVTMEFCYTP